MRWARGVRERVRVWAVLPPEAGMAGEFAYPLRLSEKEGC